MRIRTTITGLLLLTVAATLLNIQQQSSLAFTAGEEDDNVLHVRKESITTDIFELVSGIFAAILCVLSLRAYTKLKMKGMLFVSAAFRIFAAKASTTRYMIESTQFKSRRSSTVTICSTKHRE